MAGAFAATEVDFCTAIVTCPTVNGALTKSLSSRIRTCPPPMLVCSTIRSVRFVHGPGTIPSSSAADHVPAHAPDEGRTASANTCSSGEPSVVPTVGSVTDLSAAPAFNGTDTV